MAELDVGAVLVGTADAIEGILTDRDSIVRVVEEGRHPSEVAVSEVMTSGVVGCGAGDEIESAFAAMREGQFRRMPVLGEDGKPIGIVTSGDWSSGGFSPGASRLRCGSEISRSFSAIFSGLSTCLARSPGAAARRAIP